MFSTDLQCSKCVFTVFSTDLFGEYETTSVEYEPTLVEYEPTLVEYERVEYETARVRNDRIPVQYIALFYDPGGSYEEKPWPRLKDETFWEKCATAIAEYTGLPLRSGVYGVIFYRSQSSKLNFFLSGHLATTCSGLVASEKFWSPKYINVLYY